MASDLDEIDERLNYCETEIGAAGTAIQAYLSQSIDMRDLYVGLNRHYQMRLNQQPPTAVRSRVRSIIHEIRSCLDALACVLAVRNGKTMNGTYFPISKTAAILADDGSKKLKKLSDADRDKILTMNPEGETRPFLFGMHDFDRVAKHQRLGITGTGLGMGIGNGYISTMQAFMPKLDDQWRTVFWIGPGTAIDLNFVTTLRFEEPPELVGMDVVEGLRRFLAESREIVDAFR